MTRLLLILGFLLMVVFLVFDLSFNKQGPPEAQKIITLLPTKTPVPTLGTSSLVSLDYKAGKLEISWFNVRDINKLKLIPNYQEQKSSDVLFRENNCVFGASGGFYDKSNNPLGLTVIDGKAQSQSRTSALFNGFLWTDSEGNFGIGDTLPLLKLKYALQSGPLLILNKQILALKIIDDTEDRRMLAFETNRGLFFASVFHPDNDLSGPLLADLPTLLETFAKQKGIEIINALNLDGGTASSFYGNGKILTEITSIGSFWCEGK